MSAASVGARAVMLALLLALAASVGGQMAGATQGDAALSVVSAAMFVIVLWLAGWRMVAPWWRRAPASLNDQAIGTTIDGADRGPTFDIGPTSAEAVPRLAARITTLVALGYAWGAASLAGVYLGTPLRWQHGWQYAAAMGLIAAAIAVAARRPSPSTATTAVLTGAHGIAALVAVGWLVASGKAASVKADWAANVVFLAGAAIVVGLGSLWFIAALRAGDGRRPR